ncbi:MAG: indole-3-glycerol phosphate synthase TrpC [Thermodesulfovibrionales bacterium]|nr:indole-3-glycerol phosphate synthase TrpC [Thermodesulfovibrionales bacterium]
MGILDEIVSKKKERLENAKSGVPLKDIKSRIADAGKPRDFTSAIKRNHIEKIKLIAEIKKVSPSKGVIRKEFDPVKIAAIYEKKQAGAISVLTEEDFFQGRLEFIRKVKKITTKPLLRKDFIFDEYQIYESRANKADAILLIAAILSKNQAEEYLHLAGELGLSVLFEVHDLKELEIALSVNAEIIGINNRDLKTLKIDLNNTFKIKKEIPSDKIVVSESGIKTRDDILRLESAGIDAVLIGTSFMEAKDIGKKIDELFTAS